jgi:7,8-dihydroneopterin aldolase/epimerase/oxygenase
MTGCAEMSTGGERHHDRLHIEGLCVQALIGVRPWEQQVRQLLIIDLELAVDAAQAAGSDALEHAVDYGAVARRVTEYASESRFGLIETAAEQLANLVRDEFGVPWLRVRVAKPGAVPNATTVAVEIVRGRIV